MNDQTLSAVAGVLLSLAFSYIPGLSGWFDALEPTRKRLVMLGALVIVSLIVIGLSCTGVQPLITCDQPGLVGLVSAFLAALVANQATYQITPRSR